MVQMNLEEKEMIGLKTKIGQKRNQEGLMLSEATMSNAEPVAAGAISPETVRMDKAAVNQARAEEKADESPKAKPMAETKASSCWWLLGLRRRALPARLPERKRGQ